MSQFDSRSGLAIWWIEIIYTDEHNRPHYVIRRGNEQINAMLQAGMTELQAERAAKWNCDRRNADLTAPALNSSADAPPR